jgi:hypothetical protein
MLRLAQIHGQVRHPGANAPRRDTAVKRPAQGQRTVPPAAVRGYLAGKYGRPGP